MLVGLVACCAKKAATPAPARELYRGQTFIMGVRYLKRRCDVWAVLSARHGLVLPDQVLEPYDYTLDGKPAGVVEAWGEATRARLREVFPGAQFIVLAHGPYLKAVEGLPYTAPPDGCGVVERIKKMGRDQRMAAKTTKVTLGSSNMKNTIRFWLDGTPEEVFEKLKNRFRVYAERPVVGKEPKVAKPSPKAADKTAEAAPQEA